MPLPLACLGMDCSATMPTSTQKKGRGGGARPRPRPRPGHGGKRHAHPSSAHATSFIRLPPPPPHPSIPITAAARRSTSTTTASPSLSLSLCLSLSLSLSLSPHHSKEVPPSRNRTGNPRGGSTRPIRHRPACSSVRCIKPDPVPLLVASHPLPGGSLHPSIPLQSVPSLLFFSASLHRCCRFDGLPSLDLIEFQADAEEARGAEQHGPAAAGGVLPCDLAPASLTQSLPGQRPLVSPATNT